jgi:hypothetical protein
MVWGSVDRGRKSLGGMPQQTGRNGERANPRVLIFLGLHTYAARTGKEASF